jgi:hypothetical protein
MPFHQLPSTEVVSAIDQPPRRRLIRAVLHPGSTELERIQVGHLSQPGKSAKFRWVGILQADINTRRRRRATVDEGARRSR